MKFNKALQVRKAGFTMMEMVLVLAIIALLMGLSVSGMGTFLKRGKTTKARGEITRITSALDLYQVDNLVYPNSAQGLKALVVKPGTQPVPRQWQQYLTKEMIDPWGQPYMYRNPATKSTETRYDVFSAGEDGQVDTEDDIGNWSFQ